MKQTGVWCSEYTVDQGINWAQKLCVTFPITSATVANRNHDQFPLRYYPKNPKLSEGLIASES